MADLRSREAASYHRWYRLAVWRSIRAQQLRLFPLCARCEKHGLIVAANTVNHVTPHKGDWLKFISGPFESVCAPCHSSPIQSEERGAVQSGCDANGRPTSATHPWNRR